MIIFLTFFNLFLIFYKLNFLVKMKLMKFFGALAIFLGFTMGAMAQSTDNAVIEGRAQIIQSVDVINQVALDFGLVAQGANKTIGLTNNVTGLPNQGTQTTGRFLVSAAPATNVDLTFTVPTNLVSGANNLLIDTYQYGWALDNAYSNTPTPFLLGTTDITFPTNTVEGRNGVYVFIGATVRPTPAQAIGTYTANITLTATYN